MITKFQEFSSMLTSSTSAISKNSLSRQVRAHILTQEGPRDVVETTLMGFIIPLVEVGTFRIALGRFLHRLC